MKNYLIKHNTVLNELQFELVGLLCGADIDCIYDKLLRSGLDNFSYGFWVWDIDKSVELYSPAFRKSLGFEGEHDFPSVPDSWRNAIDPKDKDIAIENYYKHVESGGDESYQQVVSYNKKHGGVLTVVCHGKVVSWEDGNPKVMIGVHLPEDGEYIKK